MNGYLNSLASGRLPVEWRSAVSEIQALEEEMFLGLRLNGGIRWDRLRQHHAGDRLEKYEGILRSLSREGLVDWTGSTVRLTPSGMLLSNEIFQLFL